MKVTLLLCLLGICASLNATAGTLQANPNPPRSVPDSNWRIVAIGDYDGDGKSDILFRNCSSGENYLYPMDGTAIKPTEGFIRSVPPGSWQIVAR